MNENSTPPGTAICAIAIAAIVIYGAIGVAALAWMIRQSIHYFFGG